jgi:hypothetical protein
LKTALEELRMQMLGVQVLFGFQLEGLFQDTFARLPAEVLRIETAALAMMVLILGLLLAVPCQHRIVEQGESSLRVFRIAQRYANYALLPLAAVIACDVYAATRLPFGSQQGAALAAFAFTAALGAWYGVGWAAQQSSNLRTGDSAMHNVKTSWQVKIEQLLTEARVILPGAQALLGFQLIVMMTRPFDELPASVQRIHLLALMSLVLAVVLLIAPAAVHRVAFGGRDSAQMHQLGSRIVALALLPLICAIACDVGVALYKLQGGGWIPPLGALLSAGLLIGLWFVWPLFLRWRGRFKVATRTTAE